MKEKILRRHLIDLLTGGNAHLELKDALRGLPANLRGKRAKNLPHSVWELLEHMRIAQWDILEFSRNSGHVSPKWPEGYWPKAPKPPGRAAWSQSVRQFERDRNRMVRLVGNPKTNLFAKIPHGDGQTILREALLIADHNAYHLGQMVLVRRALGAWPKE